MKIPNDRRIAILALAARRGHFVSFDYTKEITKGENKGQTETKRRILKVGIDIAKRMDKEGTPINGKGSWTTGKGMGKNKMFVRKDGVVYVRGIDVTDNSKETKFKIFKLEGISNIC